jgi:hypothetical protein
MTPAYGRRSSAVGVRYLDSARVANSEKALVGLICGLSGGCIVLVNEVPEGQGGGGASTDATSASTTATTTGASTSTGGGGGGEPITCPGLASISVKTLATPANATIDDVVVRGDEVIYTARGEIDSTVLPGTVPAFVVYASPSLTTIQKRVLAADNAGGTIYAPLAVLNDDEIVVHSSSSLIRVRDDADPEGGDFAPSQTLRIMKADAGTLYGVADGNGGPVVAMTYTLAPFQIVDEQLLHDPGSETYVEAFDVGGGVAVWADAGPGAPAFCTAADCTAAIPITSPPNTAMVAVGAGRGFSVAPAFGDMPPYRVYAFDFVRGTALPAFNPVAGANQGVQALTVVANTVAFTWRPDNLLPLELIRCCAAGPVEDLEDATCTTPAAIAGTESATTRKIVAGPGPYAATMLFDIPGGQSIVVASWQPSP